MRKHLVAAVVAVAVGMVTAACGDDAEDEAADVGREARETATSVADRAERATRFTATLTGAAEVPSRGDPDGTGTATVNLDVSKGEVCYEVAVQKLDRPSAMHIHEAEAGRSGPVVVPLSTPTATDTTTTGCVNADSTLLGRIAAQPADFYVNVHTDAYPQGAVRGQLSQ
jgi:hypothetical protein